MMRRPPSHAFLSEFSGSKLPAPERLYRLLQRGALIGMLCGRQQFFVSVNGEIDGLVVVLGSGQTGRVVREIRLRELVRRKTRRHLLPARHAFPRIRFGKRPQVPARSVVGIGRDCASSEISHWL